MTVSAVTPIYLDTSCAVRLLLDELHEEGSERQREKPARLGEVSFVSSSLLHLEFLSVLRAKLRGGALTKAQHGVFLKCWEDWSSRRVVFCPLQDALIRVAGDLVLHTRIAGRIRALDSLHFASFMEVRRRLPDTILFSADAAMCALAEEAGAPYFNPLVL